MMSRGRLLLLFENDNSIYRLLLFVICAVTSFIHFLFSAYILHPFWVHDVSNLLALLTICIPLLSNNKRLYKFFLYGTILSFILLRCGWVLYTVNFNLLHVFTALALFIAINFFCQRNREFLAISAVNTLTLITAYALTPQPELTIFRFVIVITGFWGASAVVFLTKKGYQYLLKQTVDNLLQLNRSLVKNEEQLLKNRKDLYALLSSINDIIFEFDEAKVCLNVWDNGKTRGNVDTSNYVGKHLEDVMGDERAAAFNNAIDEVIAFKQPVDIEFPSIFTKDRWFIAKITAVRDQDGRYTGRISAAVTDITDQKRNESALKENEALLTEAQKISKLGNWWYDVESGEVYWSKNLYDILELDELPNDRTKFEQYLNLVPPDDRKRVRNYLSTIHVNMLPQLEHRFITPNGNLKFIKIVNGTPITNKSGDLKRIVGVIQDITEAKLAEKTIKKNSSELLEAQTIAKIGNWKWNTEEGRLTWSDEVFNIYGVEKRPPGTFGYFKLLLQYAHPEDKRILSKLVKNAADNEGFSCEYRITTPLGEQKYLSIITGKVIRNEDGKARKIIGTLQDITERKEAQLGRKQSENKYKRVLETINLAAISLDGRGNITFCNKHLAGLLGYTQDELLGMNWLENFIPQKEKELLTSWFKDVEIPAQYINPIVCRDGEERIISWQNTVVKDEFGNLIEATSIGEDITDQQKDREQLISAKEEAERLSEYKSEFLSVMSHEIRTPMNAVIGTTNLLLAEEPLPHQMEYLNTLKFSGENLLAIINDILDYNRMEAGKVSLNLSPFNLDDLIYKIKDAFYSRAIEKGLNIEVNITGVAVNSVKGDSMRLSQILNNLLSNAVKFTHDGSISINLEKAETTDGNLLVRFTVSDTGIGIGEQNLSKIFDPFIQETAQTQAEYGGSGLGLAITKRLVEMHGSHITVQSNQGNGTIFQFSIIFEKAQLIAKAPTVTAHGNVKGMRILVVDDNQMNLLIAGKFLKKWEADVHQAINGKLAVEKALTDDFDLVIMDLQMPIMDGFEATAIIKEAKPNLNIIALTADAMPETFSKALQAGMDGYLTKPFVPEQLFALVAKYHNPATANKAEA